MSVAALIATMGKQVALRRPTTTVDAYGMVAKSYTSTTHQAFVQERSSAEQLAQGRTSLRRGTVIYFNGAVDVQADDLVAQPPTGNSCNLYRVTGVRVPDLATTHPNAHTIVDAVRVPPPEVLA